MTRSTGTSGLMRSGSPPRRFMAWRMAARSTTAGTPVKSCRMTRAGRKGISMSCFEVVSQLRMFSTSACLMAKLSQLRIADSRSTRIEYGKRSGGLAGDRPKEREQSVRETSWVMVGDGRGRLRTDARVLEVRQRVVRVRLVADLELPAEVGVRVRARLAGGGRSRRCDRQNAKTGLHGGLRGRLSNADIAKVKVGRGVYPW